MDTAVLRSRWVGQQIDGRFPLLEWLGDIAAGDVFRTELPGPQQAAILVSSADQAADQRLRNWQIAAALKHPHLLRVSACGDSKVEESQVLYIVTELPEEALGQILPERALTADETRQMLPPILDALSFLHGEGLVHGGLEPANILVVSDQLKLSPYTLQPAGPSIPGGDGPGPYDAPETGDAPLNPAADIWSLGVTLVEALTRHRPSWVRDSGRDPLVPAALPQPFAEIARRCLRLDPAQRCTLAEIRVLLAAPRAQPAPVPAASPSAPTPQQLPLAYEHQETPLQPAPGNLRKSLRALEDDEPRRPFPLPLLFGAGALLFLLIVGFFAYSHHAKPVIAPPDASVPTAAGQQQPQPTGPTVKGEVAQRVTPEIPASAARGIRGKVEVRVKLSVDRSGNVLNASLVSQPRSHYFANQALDAARKWTFRPARVHGQPAPSTWELHFVFRPEGTEIKPTELTP
jgi:TonB family protein